MGFCDGQIYIQWRLKIIIKSDAPMFSLKLWDTPSDQPDDPLVPLFTLMLSQKTLNRMGVGARLWGQFLKHCLKVDIHNVDELKTFVSIKTYLQVIRFGASLCGSERLLHWFVLDSGPHHFGPVGLGASTAPTVSASLDVWLQYCDITAPMISVELVKTNKETIIYFDEVIDIGAVRSLYMELCLLMIREKLLEASNGKSRIRVRWAHEPINSFDYYEACFQVRPEAGSRYALIFPREDLDIESENYSPLPYLRALEDCATLRENFERHKRISHQVRQLLVLGSKQNHFYSLDQVADQLHMSVRTLTRRLSEEQVSFRELLGQVRLDLAKKQLQNTKLPIKTICSNAGFTNMSAFSRAFRKYTNISPSSYRQNE